MGYVEYDQNFHVIYSAIRSTLDELAQNLGKKGNTRHCRHKGLTYPVEIIVETNPIISWESEVCLECMTIVGNRMPYNPRAKDKEDKLYSLPVISKS